MSQISCASAGWDRPVKTLRGPYKAARLYVGSAWNRRSAMDPLDTGRDRACRPQPDSMRIDPGHARWDNPTMIVTLDSKRRLTLPTALMPAQPGQSFEAQFDADEDAVIFRRLPEREDWLDVLADCPVPMDDVPPRRRELPRKRRL